MTGPQRWPLFPQVAICQLRLRSVEPAAHLAQVLALVAAAADLVPGTLVVLPELWAFGTDLRRARELAGETPALLAALGEVAAGRGLYFAGSLPEKIADTPERGADSCHNTLFLVGPGGVLGRYRKQHLFRPWHEEHFFLAGQVPAPLVGPCGPLGALICYDLRFPELARRQVREGAGLILVSALWPAERLGHWRVLLQARAIENQAYVVGCNGCGSGGALELAGHSLVVAPDGAIILELETAEELRQVALDAELLSRVRHGFCPSGERPWPDDDGDKVLELSELQGRLAPLRALGSRIVFTNGCFDLLHSGHVRYLQQARRAGDCLVLGLNSDRSVQAIKGPERPVNPETDRARVLAALGCVDYVVIFDQETPLDLIQAIRPQILVKGADWPEEQIVGAREVRSWGGEVRRIPFERDISTTAILRRIQTTGG